MSTTTERPWPALSAARRLGPSILVVALVAAVALVSTAKGRSEPTADPRGPSLATVRGYAHLPTLPVTYEDAKEAGTLDRYDWGDHCDTTRRYNDTKRTLARLAIPSTYAPPCVPVWGGSKPWRDQGGQVLADNGGATTQGVTATTIKVVFYLPAELDISKQLENFGVVDGASSTMAGVRDLVEMSNHLYELYGRKVEVVAFHATGDGRSPSAAKADAVRVAEMGAFASIGGPTQTSSYQHELARQHILCLQCGYASTDDVLAADAPYAWGYQATPDQLLGGTIGFGAQTLVDHKAKFAGDAETRSRIRKFGVVHYEQDPPVFGPLKRRSLAAARSHGQDIDVVIQYLLDPNSLNAQAQAIVGRLKREHVTTVIFLGDPLMPRVLTQQATKQDYHPEWVFTGTVFTDTTAVARLYDQSQMAHAFGISSNPARTRPELSESWRLHTWWFGTEPPSPKTLLFWGPVVQELYLGLHLAGPMLTAQTFAGGMFNYPATGGTDTSGKSGLDLYAQGYLDGDTTPGISFGFHPGSKAADYVAVDDFTSVWWNTKARGPDENGTRGRGMWMATGLGLRLSLRGAKAPDGVSEDFLFTTKLSGTKSHLAELAKEAGLPDLTLAEPILQKTPTLDRLPHYDPWARSPAGRRGH